MPVVVTPRTVSAPAEASGSGASGSVAFDVRSGTGGQMDLDVSGLVGAKPLGLTLEPGDFDPARPVADADTARFPLDVAAGASVLRVELEGRDSDDLDLFLYRGEKLVGSATGSAADELLTEVDPEPGEYALYVSSSVAGNGSTTTAQLYTWVVQDDATGNLDLPGSLPVSSGAPFSVGLSWDGLDPTTRWFGSIEYAGSDERTFVTVN
jgi:hypothetical protein